MPEGEAKGIKTKMKAEGVKQEREKEDLQGFPQAQQ